MIGIIISFLWENKNSVSTDQIAFSGDEFTENSKRKKAEPNGSAV